MKSVSIDIDIWLDMIIDRLDFWDWEYKVPSFVKDAFIEMLEESGPYMDAEYTDPRYVVDNFIVNGSYGDKENYQHDGEPDADFWDRMEDEAIMCWPDEEYVLMHWGI